ncbi:MAG: hypothetical protein Q9163_005813 [Psora crenata]
MNRFRSKKKSDGEASRDGSRRRSLDVDVPAVPSFSSRTFRKKKNAVPEPKPPIDLSTALPPSDDFRTSLLLPKLSARFSMLKEQDDPSSLIGKANDDSVLFPKRASRLDLFQNPPGLSDIAEVDSLPGSVRPPFAFTRMQSFGSDGYNTDDGSVISRARPGEGNTMFGGRQKIYKIPVGGAGSVKNFGGQEEGEVSSSGNMGGKLIYESDISMSTFQKLREQEREYHERAAYDAGKMMASSKERDRSGSPPYASYDYNRETSSSTTSAPSQSRVSTAATSVASQKSSYGSHENTNGASHGSTQPGSSTSDRSVAKSRRLYGQGLDRDMHEQQSSALQRLGSLQKSRPPVGGLLINPLHQPMNASTLDHCYPSGDPPYTSNSSRAESPQLSTHPSHRMADFDPELHDDQRAVNPTDSGYGRSPPLSPPMSPDLSARNPEGALLASLEPNDVGKATALGAFNKPKKQYNEQQYLRRQLQLQEGRNTPSPQPVRLYSSHRPSFDEQATAGRSRSGSQSATPSMSGSSRHPWTEDRVVRAPLGAGASPSLRMDAERQHSPATDGSFLGDVSGRSPSSTPGGQSEGDPNLPVPSNSNLRGMTQPHSTMSVEMQRSLNVNPGSNHLAEPTNDTASESQSFRSEATITHLQEPSFPLKEDQTTMNADSPTLGPIGVPSSLSGLVRVHLRNDSGQSSIYPEDPPRYTRKPEARESIFGHETALDRRNDKPSNGVAEQPDQLMSHPLSSAAHHILEQAKALKNQQLSDDSKHILGNDKAQRILGVEIPRGSNESQLTWQEHMKTHHVRGASTETQKEREELANELAERRRIVQDKLQTFVEIESRSVSPAPPNRIHENSPAKPSTAFGLLKKSSKSSLGGPQEKPLKAMKTLGIDNSSRTNQLPSDLFMGREQYQDRAMPPRSKRSVQPTRYQDPPRDMNETSGLGPLEARGQEDGSQRQSPRSSKTSSACSGGADPRFRSRKGSARESSTDSSRVNGFGPLSAADSSRSPSSNRTLNDTDQPFRQGGGPPTERSQSVQSGRLRSNSKPPTSTPFLQRTAPPGSPFMIHPSNMRPGGNLHGGSSRSAPSLRQDHSPNAVHQPVINNSQYSPPRNLSRPGRKQSINKHDISEPTFVSCTSSVDTIDLPPGASLKNGMHTPSSPGVPPPIPARDARRKRTQTLLQALGRLEKIEPAPSVPSPSPNQVNREEGDEEQSSFSADEEPSSKWRQRLRKTSSEGVHMNTKARQHAKQAPSPSTRQNPHIQKTGAAAGSQPSQAQRGLPASAGMF